MTGLTHSMKPLGWVAGIGILILLLARATGAQEGEYLLLVGDSQTTEPRELTDPQRTDLETLGLSDTLVFQELTIQIVKLEKPDPSERGSAMLSVRVGDSSHLFTLEENNNRTIWPGGREGWQINMYSINTERQTVRLRAQRTVRPWTPSVEPPVPPKIAALRAARERAAAAPAPQPASTTGREGAWTMRRTLNSGAEISNPGMRLRLVRVDGSDVRTARRWATFIVNTSTTSQEVRLEEYRATFVEDYQIMVERIDVRNRPGQGRVTVTINYLPVR